MAIDLDNERRYLESVAAKGGGAATWAQAQAKKLGITLGSPSSSPSSSGGGVKTGTSSSSSTSTAKTTSSSSSTTPTNVSTSSGSSYTPTGVSNSSARTPSDFQIQRARQQGPNQLQLRQMAQQIQQTGTVSDWYAQLFGINNKAPQMNTYTPPTDDKGNIDYAGLASSLGRNQMQGVKLSDGSLLDTTDMTPQQVFAATLWDEVQAGRRTADDATAVLQSMGLDHYGNVIPGYGAGISPGGGVTTGPTSMSGQMTQQGDVNQLQQNMVASANQIDSIIGSVGGIVQEYARQSNEHLAAAGAQLESMMKMIDELEARITQQITGQMNADDPQMRAAIGLIRDEVKRQRDALLEEMNARGIVQSGLYLEMVDRMNRNELTQVQQLVGSRFADLQNQLNSAIMNLAGTRIQMLGAHNQSLNAMMAADRSTLANLGMQGLQLGLQERGMNMEDQRFYAGLSHQEQLARMQDATQRYGIDTQAATSRYGYDSQAATSRYVSDNNLAASMYGSDRSYAASVYGTDIDASVRQYLGELNASIDQQRIDLDRDSFNAYQSQVQQERIYAEMAMAQEEWAQMQQDHSSGKLTKQDLRNMMASSGYDPAVKEWLRVRIETLPTLRHDEMAVSNSANPFASPIIPPTIPSSSGYTPSPYVPGIVPGIMDAYRNL